MTQRLRIGGVVLEAQSWAPDGPASGDPIVLLHEGLGSVSAWRDFPAVLAARVQRAVFAYSRRGHGRSDPHGGALAADFMHREAEAVVPRVLDAAGIERALLLGHSDGGSIALLAAARWPDRVRALALEAPHVFVEPLSIASIAAIRERYAAQDGRLRARLAAHHADVDGMFYGWNDVWLSPTFRPWTIESELPTVRCPVLVVQGVDDEYGTAAQVRAIERLVAGPVQVELIQKCGHSPHRDQPTVVLDRLTTFMRRMDG